MLAIPGYQIIEEIYESARSLVYRGRRNQDRQPAILKVLKQEYPTPEEIARFKLEYKITRNLNMEGVVRAYSLQKYHNSLVMILEDFGGESLNRLMTYRKLSLSEFLTLAIRIADILGKIHQKNIIHKDINPSNIVFNPATEQLKIIDFGISTVLSRENPTIRNPNVLEGTLPYMSPEQTGRMNRAMDYRTDFYSLGVTFYELLTHQLPFDTTDAMELVHCHIAKQPVPPDLLSRGAREIPKAVSDIVLKLLSKTAEERYQSAYGIKADLQLILMQLKVNEKIENFIIGEYDISDKFQISQKLYGRESEIETLLTAFKRVSQGIPPAPAPLKKGGSEMMLVSGYSGIGKSALVNEVHKPITQQKGYFISGKFDQFKRNIPYSSLIEAFQELIRQLLTESEAQIATWRSQLLTALGANGQIIIDVIPEVEIIIGKQPAVAALGPTESQNRFNLVFQNFISVFTKQEHPLVIFLDDLQWADSASLKLIQLLMTEPDSHYLLLIGAYRDNEVSPTHPLMVTIDNIQKAGAQVNTIKLQNLEFVHVNQLIADTLNCDLAKAMPLTELALKKTQGNPFFLTQLLKSLYQDHLLHFNFREGCWQWNIEQIQETGITDNVVDLMIGKIQKLSQTTQQVLKLAACIGNRFDLDVLATVNEKSPSATADELWSALQEGLILPLSDAYKFTQVLDQLDEFVVSYKFLHDRVQQAAYALIPEDYKKEVHLKVGQLLLKNTQIFELEDKIFDIVNQLNIGADLITSQSERNDLAELNLMAGRKAKAATAYEAAFNYLKVGVGLLEENSWKKQYDLTLALYVEAVEAAYLSTDFIAMERLTEVVLQNAETLLDKVPVYECRILAYVAERKPSEALKTAFPVLKLLGVEFPWEPTPDYVMQSLAQTKADLGEKQIEDLYNLPKMSDPYKLATMRIMNVLHPPIFFAAPQLIPLEICTRVSLTVKFGTALESPHAYADYGLLQCGILGDIELGYQFGKLALRLAGQMRQVECRTNVVVNMFVLHWKEHISNTFQTSMDAYYSGLEVGDLDFAAYGLWIYSMNAYLGGKPLQELEKQMAFCSVNITLIKQETALQWLEVFRQATLNLLLKTDNPCHLMGEAYNEEKMLPFLIKINDVTGTCFFYLNKLILSYLFNDYPQAVENARRTENYLNGATAMFVVPVFHFYDSLAKLAIYPNSQSPEQEKILEKVTDNQNKMKEWAAHAPMNYLHKFYLVEAERVRVLGQDLEAMDYYDRAIALAQEHKYINEAALANELAAKFYLAKNKTKIAHIYIQDARYCYLSWGASAKVKDLDARYSQLLFRKSERTITDTKSTNPSSYSSTTGSGSEALDLMSVMKAAQAISGEIFLDQLLATLMKISIENAGAQKGFLILEIKGNLLIEAEGSVDRDNVNVLQPIPVESSQALSAAIINYVARTKESVVLSDASREGKFTKDPYITQNQPKSVLCAPLLNQGKLIGLLYLENNLTTGAFTPDRLEVLKLLSSQAAISIENAKLYSELRESESRLTQFLEAVPVGVFVMDANGKPYYFNRTAQQLLGKGVVTSATTEQLAEVYQVYLAGTDRLYPSAQLPAVRALSGESVTVDDMEIHQGDKIIPIEAWGTPIFDEKGNIAYGIVAIQDITERKRAEAERIKFTNQLYQLNQAYARFVPSQFFQLLKKESILDVKLGDQVQQEMSVLFSDIRDFTVLSESITPEENFKFINSYLSRMEPAIIENHGFIDKYIGDAIMALFSGSADDAVKAAIAMLHRLVKYNQHRANSGYIQIQIGIGINTGSLMLGTVGGHNRMEGTVISDAVNLASRMEGLTKDYGVSLLISHQTFAGLQNPTQYAIRMIDKVKVKGKSELVTVHEVFDADLPEVREGKLATAQIFAEALSLYNQQNLSRARQLFKDCLHQNPMDKVAQIYFERCQWIY